MTKMIKKSEWLQLCGEIREITWKKEKESNWNFQNNGIFNGTHFFSISPQTGNVLSRQILESLFMEFFAYSVIYFWKKFPNQIKKQQ